MKKILVVTAGLVITLATAMPVLVGIALERGIIHLQQQWATETKHYLTFSQFERGYRSSYWRMALSPLLGGAPQTLQLTITFNHGPLLIRERLALGWLGIYAELKATPSSQLQLLGGELLYQLDGQMNLMTMVSFTDRSNPINLSLQHTQAQLSRSAGEGRLNWRTKRLDYEGRLSQISLQSDNLALNLANVQIVQQANLAQEGIEWFNRLSYTALNARIQQKDYWLKEGALGFSRQIAGDRNQISLVASEFKTHGLDLAALDANFAVTGVPSEWVIQMLGLSLLQMPDEMFGHQAYALTQKHLNRSGALILERVGAVQDGKSFWLSGQVDAASLLALPKQAWQQPSTLPHALTGSAAINVDKTLIPIWVQAYMENQEPAQAMSDAQISVLATAFAEQGMLTDEGQMYSTKMGFKPGEITLNGKQLSLPF